MRIARLRLKPGYSKDALGLDIQPEALTIFVGSNNSGKSLILQEIEKYLSGASDSGKILSRIDLDDPGEEGLLSMIEARSAEYRRNAYIEGPIKLGRVNFTPDRIETDIVDVARLVRRYKQDGIGEASVRRHLVSLFSARLDGKARFALTEPRQSEDLQEYPRSHLAALLKNEEARGAIRKVTSEAFGYHFVIDPTAMHTLRVKMSIRPPEDNYEEQALDERARHFHQQAVDIQELSDGIKAFTGLVSVVLGFDMKFYMVDEPEAFLHPPLSRRLGAVLANAVANNKSQIFVSTHSSDFVMGCLQSGRSVNIVRLTYNQGVATAHLLQNEKLRTLMKHPLLRSSGVVNSLFHHSAIVTEGDTDRAFYQEINDRMLALESEGISDCIFLNAQNKQTVRLIVRPLREMGIPAAAIVDLDIIKKNDEFKKLIHDCFVPLSSASSWGAWRGDINKKFEDKGINSNRDGMSKLSSDDKDATMTFLGNLAAYGIFVVPNGAVESWLGRLVGQTSLHGPSWLVEVFEKMGSDPDNGMYVKPEPDDVWEFVRQIREWILNPDRKGMPSDEWYASHIA